MTDKPPGGNRAVLLGAAVAIVALCTFQVAWAMKTRRAIEGVESSVARLGDIGTRLAAIEEQLTRSEEKIDKMDSDQGYLVDDIVKLGKKMDSLVASMEGRSGVETADAPEPPSIDWTQPQLFAVAQKSAGEYGIELLADEVRVPARFVMRQFNIEYFAVMKGGKEHETLISLVGNTPKGERRPKDFGARMNNAIQAIGFKRGKAVRYTAAGRAPPEGETAYLFVEWEEKGEKVLVRAEDLVWNRLEEKPMERGKWVYVGSAFVRTEEAGLPVLAADLTAEAVATYNSPDTIFDNATDAAGDDSVFLAATPNIPAEIDECVLVIRRKDREATRIFPDPPKGEADPAEDPLGPR